MSYVEIEVPRGRTIVHDGKSYGPGKTVALPRYNAAWLLANGHAIKPGDPQPLPSNVVRPVSQAELDQLPPGPVPVAPGTALGPKVFA